MTNFQPEDPEPFLIFNGEIAKVCDVAPSTASNWVVRYRDFPQPLHTFRRTSVYSRADILAWARQHRKLVES